MKTEQIIKARVAPEITKQMCELAEGFEFIVQDELGSINFVYTKITDQEFYDIKNCSLIFAILIHRAVEGWNRLRKEKDQKMVILYDRVIFIEVDRYGNMKGVRSKNDIYIFKNYQPQALTHAECAMLDCLLDILEEK